MPYQRCSGGPRRRASTGVSSTSCSFGKDTDFPLASHVGPPAFRLLSHIYEAARWASWVQHKQGALVVICGISVPDGVRFY